MFKGGDVAVYGSLGLALQSEEEGKGQCQKGAVQVILLSYIMNNHLIEEVSDSDTIKVAKMLCMSV